MRRIKDIIIIIGFILLIAFPLSRFHMGGGEESALEKRKLAEIPSLDRLEKRIWDRSFMEDVESWVNDHIGGRITARKIYAQLMVKGFGISTSETVVLGREGYLFFNKNNNLEIGKGTYPLDEDVVQKIVSQQQRINAHYEREGIRYFLLLTPSKVSVYPEYLPFDKQDNKAEPAEFIENALGESCAVLNVKNAIINHKEVGNMFFLTDTHWNTKGTYIAYQEVLKYLNPQTDPIPDSFSEYRRLGDLAQSLGTTEEVDKEDVPRYAGTWTSRQTEESELDDEFIEILNNAFEAQETPYIAPEMFINNAVQKGRIVIYGDSMVAGYLNFPRYLCEHYHQVVVLRLREITPEVDEYLDPDIVIYSTTERLIAEALPKAAQNIK